MSISARGAAPCQSLRRLAWATPGRRRDALLAPIPVHRNLTSSSHRSNLCGSADGPAEHRSMR
eukprot:scaffold4783_cov373-Prasinococcus_capsulatus_cf.AAC.5